MYFYKYVRMKVNNFIYFTMKRIFNFVATFLLLLMPLSLMVTPVAAQTEDEIMLDTSYEDYDWDSYMSDYDYEYDWDSSTYDSELSEGVAAAMGTFGLLFGGVMLVFSIAASLALYVYTALALMNIAKKLEVENAWFAWVPILNMALLLKMGMQNPWLILLVLIPGLGALIVAILSVIATMKICEKRGYDKLLGLLSLVPVANLVLLGVLAWGKRA